MQTVLLMQILMFLKVQGIVMMLLVEFLMVLMMLVMKINQLTLLWQPCTELPITGCMLPTWKATPKSQLLKHAICV